VRHHATSPLWRLFQDARVATDVVGDGITRLTVSSRWTRRLGFDVSAYVVDDLMVDTGFAHARQAVLDAVDGHPLVAICCSHNHEDHTGNCRPLATIHECPVYIRHHRLRYGEGVRRLKPYRAWWWGSPGRFDAEEMPEVVVGGERRLRALPAPGHSMNHVVLWEEASGTVFTGDLFISPGASAVMTQENPYDLVDSLRRVAAVGPRLMLTGHGTAIEDPVPRLLAKADRVEAAAARAVELHGAGMPERAIVRDLFSNGHAKDRWLELMTQGEFSRVNFVRAAVLHARER
jgi:glyoxylase-like metal-dependent hydrolase (beta-lactamase superfamily II)